ncbi:MAG: hypothetical protein PHZ28_03825 [Candidatus Izemoplasmatales bacterium]|nr:hypothetical protein [Candidatus Izemoplasmatales bacterium]
MATYKKGFKKQNTELLLLKTIVAIIVAVILVVAVAFIYDSVTKWKDYSNYSSIEKYEDAFALKDANQQAITDYVIYVYSDTNEGSINIKNDVLKIANKLDDDFFFLLNTSTVEGENADFLEAIQRTTVSTPMIIVVNDGEVEELFVGSTAVIDILTQIQNDTYAPFIEE